MSEESGFGEETFSKRPDLASSGRSFHYSQAQTEKGVKIYALTFVLCTELKGNFPCFFLSHKSILLFIYL